jgi:membrane glycosyltransferase
MRADRVRTALTVGPEKLDSATRLYLLSDPVALSRLHSQVWSDQNEAWLGAWRKSVAADPHAPLLPLQPDAVVPQNMVNA